MGVFDWISKSKKKELEEPILNEVKMLFAHLLFDTEPTLDDNLIEKELFTHFQNVDCPKDNLNETSRQYFFRDFPVEFQEGSIPAQCTIFKMAVSEQIRAGLEKAYQQTWHWPEARQKTEHCNHYLLLSDLITRPLDYKIRATLFQKFVSAVSSALKPKAIYFPTSEKLLETSAYIDQVSNPDKDWLYGLLNVRLFTIKDDEMLMDTVGLHGLGLPDFQFRFAGHEPGKVAALLHSYAHYIYQYGSVIKNGNTVEGIDSGSKWKCIYNSSMVEPVRNVLEIHE